MKKTLLLLALLAAMPMAAKTALPEMTRSQSDLQYSDLATVWDEALPLGNATVGELVWQKDGRLRFSLDRTDLWDLRPVHSYASERFSFEWVKEQIRKKDYKPVIDQFEHQPSRGVAPSKLPGAAMEFASQELGPVTASRVFLRNALCEVSWQGGARMQSFVQADRPVGWFVFEGVPDTFRPELLPPDYEGRHTDGDGGLGASALSGLGYKQGPVSEEPFLITYHQPGWGDYYYDVAVAWRRSGDRLVGVWSVTSSLSGENALDEVKQALGRGLKKSFRRHMQYWNHFWQQSTLAVPDAVLQRQYDREMYKLGSTSRRDSYPISLQAIWTADNGRLPPWKGDFHHDLNTQLSYWPVYSSNHLDEGMAYLNTLWNQRPVFREFTRSFFGKDGIDVPGTCSLDGHLIGGWVQYSMSQTTGAWLAHHFYLHWKYSADPEFLAQRAYPFLAEVALFLEQQTVIDSQGRRMLEFTSSPEINDNKLSAWFTDFTNYDLSLTRFAFTAAAEMADSLRLTDKAAHWRKLASELPPFSTDPQGALTIAPSMPYSYSHRHFSHAMAIHPLGLIDKSHGAEDCAIIDSTLALLHRRGPDYWCGYSYSWLGNMEARARHGERAAEALRTFAQCFTLRNSFHANGDQSRSGKSKFLYRPFTLEGNFAFAAGLQEMLLQSHTGVIEVFPAVPAQWQDISFRDLRAQGAFLVTAEKRGGQLTSLRVRSERGGLLRIRSPRTGQIIERRMKRGETIEIKDYELNDMSKKLIFIPLIALALGASARGTNTENEQPVLLLRFSYQHSNTPERWADMLSILKQHPEACDEVWFSTGTTTPPMQDHRNHVDVIKKAKQDLSRLGIGTSLQVQMTIGHGDASMKPEDWVAKTWSGWTGSTGVEAKYCNCPRQPAYLEYVRQMARTYAEVHPRVVWIDDDLRYDNHSPATQNSRIGCWCATCLADFSQQEGRQWTRQELDQAMGSDKELAQRWKMFSIGSLCRVAEIIAQETKAVSPETHMGYQKTFWDSDTTVVREVLQTLARVSGHKVGYRAGGGAYYDRSHPINQIEKSMDAARYMRVLGCPDYVETWCPEIESWPRHYGSRTARAVLLEDFTALAYGMNAVSMYVLDRWEETPQTMARSMVGPLADASDVLRRYARANRGTQAVGFATEGNDNMPLYEFGTQGIPVLPGLGRSLGTLTTEQLKPVNFYSQPSSAVQARREQMDRQAPAPVLCQSPYIGQVIPRVDAQGQLRTIGLINCRIDEQGPVRLQLRSLPQGVKRVVWRELRQKPVRLKIQRDEQGRAYVDVPSIQAWNAGFVEI